MTDRSNLYELPSSTLADIPRVLRAIADEIEAGKYGKTQVAAVIIESDAGDIRTFGAGNADHHRAIAMFHLGIAHLVHLHGTEHFIVEE